MNYRLLLLCLVLPPLAFAPSASADWTRFRGPNGSGISSEANATPVEWTPDDLKWKVELPGPGSSSPIVVGDKVFVTCWTGYGAIPGLTGEQEDLRRHLLCYDRKTGSELWRGTVKPVLPEDRYGGMFAEHGYATHTPVSDGERIYAFFGKSGVVAYDLDGNKLWQKSVGTGSGDRNWGSSSSPIVHGDLVIVPATAESTSVVAFDKLTGEEKWKSESEGYASTWGSPIVVEADGRADIVISVPYEVWALNATTGKLSWYADALGSSSICASCITDEKGMIYAIESNRGEGGGIAIRAGGSKDVTKSHVTWNNGQAGRIASPIVSDGKIYSIASKVFYCLDAATGDEIYKSRMRGGSSTSGGGGGRRGGQDYGSPVMADGKIYFTSRGGDTYVIKAGDKYEQLAVNRVTEDREDFSATPAISDGQIFIRSSVSLYCIE